MISEISQDLKDLHGLLAGVTELLGLLDLLEGVFGFLACVVGRKLEPWSLLWSTLGEVGGLIYLGNGE